MAQKHQMSCSTARHASINGRIEPQSTIASSVARSPVAQLSKVHVQGVRVGDQQRLVQTNHSTFWNA